MTVPLNVNGVVYNYPQQGDTNWGPTLTSWSTAVTNGMLQKAGGLFTLTAETDFGASFGLKALYLKSRESNISSAGVLRLANASAGIGWRNAANNSDLILTTDASNNLLFNGIIIGSPNTLTNSHIFVGNASNVPTDVAMSGDVHISNTGATTIQNGVVTGIKIANNTIGESNIDPNTITNVSINSVAAIALSKLAALNPFISPVTDSNGFLTNSSTTATEIGYVHGVTSNIQTQINTITGAGTFVAAMMMPFAGNSAPAGWLLCNGSAVSRTTYSNLFGAIGTTYGSGDGSTTFNLPDGTNRTMVGQGGSIAPALGNTAGNETHVISSGELPTHNHAVTDPGHIHSILSTSSGGAKSAVGAQDTNANGMACTATPSDPNNTVTQSTHSGAALIVSHTTSISIQNAGSSTAMSLVQPSLGINWIIKT